MSEEIELLEETKIGEDIEKVNLFESDTTCTVCFAEFLDPEDLYLHVNQVHQPNTLINCPFCSSMLPDKEVFCMHFVYTHILSVSFCKYCLKIFTDISLFRRHEREHCTSSKRIYFCSNCKSTFPTIQELQHHEYENHRHSGEGVLLNDYYSILSSILNIKVDNFFNFLRTNTLYTCTKCRFAVKDVNIYIEHLKKSNCRSYTCDTCWRVYRKKDSIIMHMLRHPLCRNNTRIIQKQCRECCKYIDASIFNYHKKSCKVIKCNTCNIIFSSVNELSTHQSKKHPLAISLKLCKYCHKEFVGIISMSKHVIRSHKSQFHLYKYKCVYCELYYQHPQKLFAHFYSKHGDLHPYTCKICNKKFRVRKRFTLHIKLDHKSIGFVEFDKNFHVYFASTKSNDAFQPSSIVNEHYIKYNMNKNDNLSSSVESNDGKINTEANLAIEEVVEVTRKDTLVKKKEIQKHINDNNSIVQQETNTGELIPKEINKDQINNDKGETKNDDDTDFDPIILHSDYMSVNDTEGNQTDVGKKPRLKRKRKIKAKNSDTDVEIQHYSENSSDDEPLLKVRKKLKKHGKKVKTVPAVKSSLKNKKKLTCPVCNKYCYTHQNYSNHMSLHSKTDRKKCIKCYKVFRSKHKLHEHVTKEHSSSRLTETLKSLLEKRKRGEVINLSEGFQKTIKQVCTYTEDTTATLTSLPNSQISVKKFIENFTPEEGSKNTITIDASIVLKPVTDPIIREPIIKMIKCKPEPAVIDRKLTMPIKFKENYHEVHDVSIKLVQKPTVQVKLNFGNAIQDTHSYDEYFDDTEADGQYEEVVDSRSDGIPEVAQEVMLEGTEEPPRLKVEKIPHKIIIPKLPSEVNKVRIAHLLPTAPYYKIVKVGEILKQQMSQKPETEEPADIKLPDGTKLVNVNPLAHLLGDKPVESVLPVNKYYQPKRKNFEKAIAKALLDLDKPAPRKRTKKTRFEEEKDENNG